MKVVVAERVSDRYATSGAIDGDILHGGDVR